MTHQRKFLFDECVVSVTSVQKACYFFINEISSEVTTDNNKISCKIFFKKDITKDMILEFEARFRNEVLDNSLREKVASETEGVRNLILGLAFSKTGLQDG